MESRMPDSPSRIDTGRSEKGKTSWVYSVLPINVASGPVGTLVQLYILQLRGTGIGLTLGLLLSVAWTGFLPLQLLVIPLSTLSILSALLSVVLIKEPNFTLESDMIVMHRRSFYGRFLAAPLLFLRFPKPSDFRKVFKSLRNELTRQIPVLYLSIFAFYLGSSLFNSSYVASLYHAGVTQSQIFLVSLAAMAIQTVTFHFAGPYIEKRTLKNTAIGSLALRSFCYSAIGFYSFLVSGVLYLSTCLILYPIGACIAYAVYYTASNTMIFNTLGPQSQGSTLGVYSALVGIATTVGSLVSGFSSFYLGFYFTFNLASGFLILAALQLKFLFIPQER